MPRPKPAKQANEEDLTNLDPPTSINPYQVLSVPKDGTDDQIKKAYRKAALRHHPDKAKGTDAPTAHTDFQCIAFAYSILSTPSRRTHYDLTGSTTPSSLDSSSEDPSFSWSDFFRARYEEITTSALDTFLSSYKHSDAERTDLLNAYVAAKGNMDRVYESVMGSDVLADDERFRGIIEEAVEAGEVEGYDAFVNESARSRERTRKKAVREAEEAKKEAEKRARKKEKVKKAEEEAGDEARNGSAPKMLKGKKSATKKERSGDADADADLVAMIQKRQTERSGNFLNRLEAKYAGGGEEVETKQKRKGSRKRKQVDADDLVDDVDGDDDGAGVGIVDEPLEEAFKAMGERMQKAKKTRR